VPICPFLGNLGGIIIPREKPSPTLFFAEYHLNDYLKKTDLFKEKIKNEDCLQQKRFEDLLISLKRAADFFLLPPFIGVSSEF
jgi:hypothetical protein